MDAKRKFSDILLLYAARALRGFGDGFAIIVLPAYLAAIGFNAAQIGLVAAAALLGTALFTLAVGFLAPRYDLKNLLIAGAALMTCTGLAFPQFEAVGFLIAVAFFGTINPSTGDIGVLIPLEHAMLTAGVRRPRAHAHLRALQPDRRAVDGGWRARRGRAGFPGRCRLHAARRVPGDVLRLCRSGARQRRDLFAACRTPMPSSGRRPRR